jgi:septum formation protein
MEHPLKNLDKYKIILASNSPRRKELLGQLGIPFTTRMLNDIDESFPSDLPADNIAEYISCKKAEAYRKQMANDELIITADTIVVSNDKVLGKPKDENEACEMLRELSGHAHKVITGVTITTASNTKSFSSVTEVVFANLTDQEIKYYVENYRPLDKAGAYGIQEWIGCVAVSGMNGSYYNVMGLPIFKLYQELKEII